VSTTNVDSEETTCWMSRSSPSACSNHDNAVPNTATFLPSPLDSCPKQKQLIQDDAQNTTPEIFPFSRKSTAISKRKFHRHTICCRNFSSHFLATAKKNFKNESYIFAAPCTHTRMNPHTCKTKTKLAKTAYQKHWCTSALCQYLHIHCYVVTN